jgi:hypothetical protein
VNVWVRQAGTKKKEMPSVSVSHCMHPYCLLTGGMTVVSGHYNPVLVAFTPNPGQKLENSLCRYRHALVLFALTCVTALTWSINAAIPYVKNATEYMIVKIT